ncbi:MAG: class I SAM-dependent methyltransferase [Marinoscillum sp.]
MTVQQGFHWIKKGIIAIATIIANPKKLYFVLNNEDHFRSRVSNQFPGFQNGLPQISLSQLTPNFDQSITHYSFLGGTSSPIDIALLKTLALRYEQCTYFEIGTWRGESALNLMGVTSKIISLNLPKEELNKRGTPVNEVDVQDFYLSENDQVIKLKTDSSTFDYQSIAEKIDLAFIDGDHHYEAVKLDSANVIQYLIDENSIVVWHDYTRNYSTIWWEVLLGILKGVPHHHHKNLYHVRNTNCAIMLPFELTPLNEDNPFKPLTQFEVHIKSSNS